MRSLAIAIGTLTTVRVPVTGEVTRSELAASTAVYPLVGAAIGVLVSMVLWLPLPEHLRAAAALIVWIVATRAFHLDGWADCCDAAFAPDRSGHEDPYAWRHAILKDPQIGTFGVVGLVSLLLIKWAALTSVPLIAPIVAAAVARYGMVLVIGWFRAARPTGLVAAFGGTVTRAGATIALGVVIAGVILTERYLATQMAVPGVTVGRILVSILLGIAGVFALARFLSNKFGGVTGDVCGAAAEFAELVVLLAFVPWVS